MIHRVFLMVLGTAALAACSFNDTPDITGHDALGLPIYTLEGESLAKIELTANSDCLGGSRPYYRSIEGKSGGMRVSYTCE